MVMPTGEVTLDVSQLYSGTGTAKLADLPAYEEAVRQQVPAGAVVRLTGAGPIWLYLRIAHVLHGRAKRLLYHSPVTGDVVIFDHDPY